MTFSPSLFIMDPVTRVLFTFLEAQRWATCTQNGNLILTNYEFLESSIPFSDYDWPWVMGTAATKTTEKRDCYTHFLSCPCSKIQQCGLCLWSGPVPCIRSSWSKEARISSLAMAMTSKEATNITRSDCMLQGPGLRGSQEWTHNLGLGLVSGWESEPGSADLLKTPKVTPSPFLKPGFLPIKNPKWYSFLSIISDPTILKLNSIFP